MQFPRRFWIAAVTMLAGLLVTTSAHAQTIKILPADTEMVVTFNLQQMLKSEVMKSNKLLVDLAKGKILEQLEEKGVAKFLKQADFDMFRDLSSVTVGVPAGRNPEEIFILIDGKFDADKIEAAVADASKEVGGGEIKVKTVKIATVNAFEITPKDQKTIYIGILDQKTMIACAVKTDFAEAVARLNGTKTSTFKAPVIKGLMETVNNKQSISFMATSKMLAKLAENNPNADNDQFKMAMALAQQLDGFSAAITIQKNVDFQLGVNAKDADAATKFAGSANGGILFLKGMVAGQAKQNEKLSPAVDIVNSLRVSTKGSNLVITGQITFEAIEKLLQNLPMP